MRTVVVQPEIHSRRASARRPSTEEMLFFVVIPPVRAAHLFRRRFVVDVAQEPSNTNGGPVTGVGYTLPGCFAVARLSCARTHRIRTGLFRRRLLDFDGHRAGISSRRRRLADQTQCPVVSYDERHTTGIRFPFDIPIEDFLFGFALITAVLLLGNV